MNRTVAFQKILQMKFNLMLFSEKNFLKVLCALPLLALLLTGCATNDYSKVMEQTDQEKVLEAARLHVGDSIIITFDGLPENPSGQDKTINDDGTITLSDIGAIKAVGLTTGDLEKVIHDKYVPHFFNHLTVTVKAGERVFYVSGEVGSKSRQVYVGQITVTKAIAAAGGFLETANHKKVLLIRASGQRFKINCDAIQRGEAPDPPVYPGDQIIVPQRSF